MIHAYQQGVRDLMSVYESFLHADLVGELGRLGEAPADRFVLDDSLWASVVYEFAAAYHQRKLDRQHLLKSLTPLYLGWVSSYVVRTQADSDDEAEQKIELLALAYEQLKTRLVERWDAK
jgi:hypothetical protein